MHGPPLTVTEPRAARGARSSGAGAKDRMARLGAALIGLLRSHWPFVVVAALGIALRVLAILAYSPTMPLRNNDPYRYLERAITMSPEGSYHPFLYSAMLKPFLLADALSWVAIVQHAAAIGVAVLLYALLRRLGLGAWLATVGVVPVLLDGYQIALEQQLFTETFFELSGVAALVLLAWNRQPTWPAVAGAGFLLGITPLVRYAGLALVPAALVYVAVRRIGWRRFAVLAAAFALPLLAYATWFKTETGAFALTNRNGFYLFGRVAEFADCTRVRVPSDERLFCTEQRGTRSGTGLFHAGLPRRVLRDPSYNARASDFARRMIRAMPASYVGAVASDFRLNFASRSSQDAAKWLFPLHLRPRDHRKIPPGINIRFELRQGTAEFLRDWQKVFSVYGPLLALLIGLGLAGGIVGRAAGRAEAWLFTLATLGLLLFPTIFAVYHFRYSIPAIPFAGAAGALGAHLVWRRLSAHVRPVRDRRYRDIRAER